MFDPHWRSVDKKKLEHFYSEKSSYSRKMNLNYSEKKIRFIERTLELKLDSFGLQKKFILKTKLVLPYSKKMNSN